MRYNRVFHRLTISPKELKKAFSSYWDYVDFIAEICVRIGIPVEEYIRWIEVSNYDNLPEAKEDEQTTMEKEV